MLGAAEEFLLPDASAEGASLSGVADLAELSDLAGEAAAEGAEAEGAAADELSASGEDFAADGAAM